MIEEDTTRITFEYPRADYAQLTLICKRGHLSVREYMSKLLDEALKKEATLAKVQRKICKCE